MTTSNYQYQGITSSARSCNSKSFWCEMAILPTIKNAYLLIKDNLIADFGSMENLPELKADTTIDATGKMILPTWCDSHTHIVYAGNREQEFVDRINGLTYEEIANRGGGILNSAKKLNETIRRRNLPAIKRAI